MGVLTILMLICSSLVSFEHIYATLAENHAGNNALQIRELIQQSVTNDVKSDTALGRKRRWVFGLADALGFVFDISLFIIDDLTDPSEEIISRLAEIKATLTETNQRLNELSEQVEDVMHSINQNHEVTRIAATFQRDVLRLKYFMLFVTNANNFNGNNQIIIDDESQNWADAVLSERADGIGQVLYNIHEMITGSFSTKPILDVYMDGLRNKKRSDIWIRMDQLSDTLKEMERSGYACWAIALKITNRSDEKVSTVKRLLEERFTIQKNFLIVDERYKVWPKGFYGLVQAAQGCPSGGWLTGWRFHDTEDDDPVNRPSVSNIADYIKGSFDANNMRWEFCIKNSYGSKNVQWPPGRYCIFAASSSCPSNFGRGWEYFDDEDDDNINEVGGHLPSGRYDRNTRYEFCCRDDGSAYNSIVLPLTHPFVLFPFHGEKCQQVEKMQVLSLYFYWDCEDDDNQNARSWPHPYGNAPWRNMQIYMCYYYY